MGLRKRSIAASVTAVLFSSWVSALGLGEITLSSGFNEPLEAEIPILNVGDLSGAEIIAGLASVQDFQNAGVDRELILRNLRFQFDFTSSTGPVIKVSSTRPILEPYLDFLVDVQWASGRLLREYTLLLDLPIFSGDQVVKNPQRIRSTKGAKATSKNSSKNATPLSQKVSSAMVPETVAGGQSYSVNSGDTLWNIASSLSSDGHSIYQKMAAIQQLNPSAFINGNINLLRRGSVLRLPEYGEIAFSESAVITTSVPVSAATIETTTAVTQQQIDATAEVTEPPGEDASYPSMGRLKLSALNPSSSNDSKLEVYGSQQNDEVGQGIRTELDTIQEELNKTQRENTELKERLASFEQQLSTMQQMIEFSDDELRTMQLAVSQKTENAPGPFTVNSDSAKGVDTTGIDPKGGENAGVATKPNATVSPMNVEFQKEKGWLDKLSSYMAYLVGLVVLLIASIIFMVSKKRRDSEQNEVPANRTIAPTPHPKERKPDRNDAARKAPTELDRADGEEKPDQIVIAEPDTTDREEVSDQVVAAEPDTTEREEAPDEVVTTEPDTTDREEVSGQVVAEAEPADTVDTAEDIELDLTEFELDSGADISEPVEEPVDSGSLEQELNLDEFDFLNDADEAGTQLELAQAYIDMGDSAGAREMLGEVMESGNDDQKKRAQGLLDQLS